MPPKERVLPKMKVEIPVEHRIPKKASPRVNHVRQWAKEHNMTFFKSLKEPDCKSSYHEGKGK